MSAKTLNAVDISRHDLWIGGKSVAASSGQYFDDRNPQDDSVLAHIAEATAQDVDTAVQAAHAAFASYGRTLASEREAWLSRAAGIMEGRGRTPGT